VKLQQDGQAEIRQRQVIDTPSTAERALAAELSLTPLIRLTLAESPSLEVAAARVMRSQAALEAARAAYWPRVTFVQKYGVSNSPVQTFMFKLHEAQFSLQENFNQPDIEGDFHSAVTLNYDLYTGGARKAGKRSARARLASSRLDDRTIRNAFVFRVTEAFYEILRARDFVRLQETTLRRIAKHLDIAQSRFDAGVAVRSDVLFVKVRQAEVREELIAAQTRLSLAWAALENAVGRELVRSPLPDAVPPLEQDETVDQLEECVAAGLVQRTEIRALARQADAASAEIDAARAGHLPQLSAQASYDVHADHDLSAHDDSFFIGLALRLKLVDGGRTRSAIRQSRARLREIQAQQRELVDNITLDVQRAYYGLQEARGRLAAASEAIVHAEESLREVEVRYENGAATVVELVDAQTDLSGARLRQADSRAQVEIARANLARAIGRFAAPLAGID
jgi:outer membrane protein TolC